MYPLKPNKTFAYNQWYVAATSDEVGRELAGRRILDIPVVFYRTEDGDPVAFHDMCPHRRYPLSKGKLVGNTIRCGYHGFTFEPSGKCIKLPTNDRIPPNYRVRSFPLVERWEWIWIWMGDPALADPDTIPDHSIIRLDAPGWEAVRGPRLHIDARYTLLHENLLDLSHLTFLHEDTIGSAGIATTRVEIEEKDRYMEVLRRVEEDNMEGVPFAKVFGLDGPVDRFMVQQFFAPSLHTTGSTFSASKTDPVRPGHHYGAFRILHGVTPETPTTTHYFLAFSRDFAHSDDRIRDGFLKSIGLAVSQDIDALEAVETMISPGARAIDDLQTSADTAGLRGRARLVKLIEAEERQGESGAGRTGSVEPALMEASGG